MRLDHKDFELLEKKSRFYFKNEGSLGELEEIIEDWLDELK